MAACGAYHAGVFGSFSGIIHRPFAPADVATAAFSNSSALHRNLFNVVPTVAPVSKRRPFLAPLRGSSPAPL